MSETTQENLKKFQIIHSGNYIQIIPISNRFTTQILINKRTFQIIFESINPKLFALDIDKQYQFGGSDVKIQYASLILGIVEIENQQFLLYVDNVFVQAPFPPTHSGIYQIASIKFVEFGHFVSNNQKQIIETMKREIFNFSFYFSFERDLTLTFQRQMEEKKGEWQEMYFWNFNMIKQMMQQSIVQEWFIPVIQGHYGKFQVSIGNYQIQYYLISRRSKYRSGTRFYNRGLDENSKCSHFIETEQVIILLDELISFVLLSGSVPLFWEQKSQSDKIKLTRNKQLTAIPFVEHFVNIKNEYERVFVVNLLEKKKENENLLLQSYQQLFAENEASLTDFARYLYFDINDTYKHKNYQEIFQILTKLDPIIKEFGFFKYSILKNKILHLQHGVFRISCLDCLSRTNNFMQALSFFMLSEELCQAKVIHQHTTNQKIKQLLFGSDSEVNSLILQFRNLWEDKADFQSMIYTGSRATSGKKNKFLDDLEDSFISLQRLYNQKFIDRIKQMSLDIVLHHKHYNLQTLLKDKHKIPLKITIISWNVNATDVEKLREVQIAIQQCEDSDLIVFGIQEMIQLSTNNVVNNNQDQSSNSVKWGKYLEKLLHQAKEKKIFVQKVQMVGLMLIMFVTQKWKHSLKSVQKDSVKTGMGGQFGNKGGVIIRVRIFQTSLCFTCSHLSAGFSKTKERLQDFEQIHKKAFQQNKVGVQNEAEIQYSDYKFFFGDLNFRIAGQFKDIKEQVDQALQNKNVQKQIIQKLLINDQLSTLRRDPNSPSLLTFYSEPDIAFLPTYKLQKASGKYTTEKGRNPSWCDRILYWNNNQSEQQCECYEYSDLPIKGSDHRPIIGKFKLTVTQKNQKY